MAIVFYCQSCGSRFVVAPSLAGKAGRCKHCGQRMVVPRAEELSSLVAVPAAPVAARVAVAPAAPAAAAPSSWLAGSLSRFALKPLTEEGLPSVRKGSAKPSPLDDLGDSKPYVLAEPVVAAARGRGASGPAGAVVRAWRHQVGGVQKVFRWLNESAYLVSVPFIILLILGAVLKNRPLALFGGTFVVLLNVGRFVAAVGNLALVPLKSGLDARKLRKPARRLVEPVLTIVLVFLAFRFIPWLSEGMATKGSAADQLRSGFATLKKDMTGEVDKVVDKAKTVDLEKLGAQAQEKLKGLGSPSGDGPSRAQQAGDTRSPESKIGDLIKSVGERARATIEESQPQP
jgi:hypothetical protein